MIERHEDSCHSTSPPPPLYKNGAIDEEEESLYVHDRSHLYKITTTSEEMRHTFLT